MIVLLLPETLRSIAGNGSIPLKGVLYEPTWGRCAPWRKAEALGLADSNTEELQHGRITLRMFYEPLLFLFEKDIFCTLFYGSIVFTVWSMVSASTSTVLIRAFNLSTIQYVSMTPNLTCFPIYADPNAAESVLPSCPTQSAVYWAL